MLFKDISPHCYSAILMLSFVLCCSPNIVDKGFSDTGNYSGKKINRFFDLELNGSVQKILIESNDTENNPVLLYLHGGPGSSALIYSYLYSEKLKNHFIFVNWDQRGTAYSYHDNTDISGMSEEQIRSDALELTKYLLKKFNKKKIFLLGHSFGSVIGLQLAANNPELFYGYIGAGQVIPSKWDESVKITYEWLHKILEQNNDREGIARIEKDRFPFIDLVEKYGGHHRLSIDLESLMKGSPYYFEGYFDLLEKGKNFSRRYVSENTYGKFHFRKSVYKVQRLFNRSIYRMDVPLYFFEGVNDHVIACAPELVVEYCKSVESPHKEIIWFKNSAHYMNVEEPLKFQDELIRIKNECYR